MKILELFETFRPCSLELHKPYVIAEAGVNHEGSMDTAKRLIDEAKEGGAEAIKFQTYKASTLASKDSPAYWDTTKEPTQSQFDLFSKHDKFWKSEMVELKQYCDTVGIEFMSTPFDLESAKFLNDLMPVFKISSSDITNKPFIKFVAGFGKPVILSTGASQLHEIQEAVSWFEPYTIPVALLHCVLNYPTPDEHAQLARISGLRRAFPEHIIGYSDHTLPKNMKACELAAVLGALIIEKHFTHDKSLPGNDHYHAMDKNDLKLFRKNIEHNFTLLGSPDIKAFEFEKPAIENARRSLVAAVNIPLGKIIEHSDLTCKRPAHGISPRSIDEVIGKTAAQAITEDEVLKWNMLN